MQREYAYNIGRGVSRFIDKLKENEFDYTEVTRAISSQRLSGPRLGRLVRDIENYVIIPNGSSKDSELKIEEKERLIELLEKL